MLTDTVMPKMNGKELAEQLSKTRPKMVVLFMSGYPLEVLAQQGKIEPSLHLIQKPFSNGEVGGAGPQSVGSKVRETQGLGGVKRPAGGTAGSLGG